MGGGGGRKFFRRRRPRGGRGICPLFFCFSYGTVAFFPAPRCGIAIHFSVCLSHKGSVTVAIAELRIAITLEFRIVVAPELRIASWQLKTGGSPVKRSVLSKATDVSSRNPRMSKRISQLRGSCCGLQPTSISLQRSPIRITVVPSK